MLTVIVLLLLSAASAAFLRPFNTTLIPFSFSASSLAPIPSSSPFLDAVAAKALWDPDAKVTISSLDDGAPRVGVSQLYEFRFRVGKTVMMIRFSDYDDDMAWREVVGGVVRLGEDLVAGDDVAGVRPAVRGMEIVGPVELIAGGGGRELDRISLSLPNLNVTYRGLKHIVVGNGITVTIEGVQEVSLSHPYDIGLSLNGSLATHGPDSYKFHNIVYSSCAPLLSINLVGSASVAVYGHLTDGVEAVLKSPDTIQLSRKKCYDNRHAQSYSSCLFCSVSSRLALIDKVMGSLMGSKKFHKSIRFLKVNITSSALVKFRVELEKEITKNDREWKKVPEWKEKPKSERIWLEIMAKIDKEGKLVPVKVKKLKKRIADSIAWSSLMSNISLAEFHSLVSSPEALTLDVK